MPNLHPGVLAANGRIGSADDAAARAAALAERAGAAGTFGVGGLLVTKAGEIVAEAVNAVVRGGKVADPTAHVERQLVDWFFLNPDKRPDLPPDEFVIVSSLDPCAMCAGAILRAGLNAVAVAEDPVSGVHDLHLHPDNVPRSLVSRAARHFALLGVAEHRPPAGDRFGDALAGLASRPSYVRCREAFAASVDRVRRLVGGGADAGAVSGAGGPFYAALFDQHRHKLADHVRPLDEAVGDWPAAVACILEDASGSPILGVTDAASRTPADTGVLRLVRAYTRLRQIVPDAVATSLPHPRFCSIVIERFPAGDDEALLDLGAIGSFMEEERPPGARPALLYVDNAGGAQRPQEILASLPPLYAWMIGLTVARRPHRE